MHRGTESRLAQLESFKAATKEVGQTTVREEPGCLVLYAVSEKENPARVIRLILR